MSTGIVMLPCRHSVVEGQWEHTECPYCMAEGYEEVLRDAISSLSAGGYNQPGIMPINMAAEKLKWGIDEILKRPRATDLDIFREMLSRAGVAFSHTNIVNSHMITMEKGMEKVGGYNGFLVEFLFHGEGNLNKVEIWE